MPRRKAEAEWKGGLKGGIGWMKTGTGSFQGNYNFGSRFEEGQGTNPEELIAAAHAGCFSMALAGILEQAGFEPKSIKTTANVTVERTDGGFSITRSDLHTEADVPDIDEPAFRQHAETAKKGCPVSKALAGINISLDAKLAQIVTG